MAPNPEKKQKNFRAKYFFALLFFFFTSTTFAQLVDCSVNANCSDPFCQPDPRTIPQGKIERGCDCFDGVDNDGDGKIDKADTNCASYYGATFIGEGSDCNLPISGGNPFTGMTFRTGSSQNTADTQSKVVVGDVDGDGAPDAVITSKFARKLSVVATWGTNQAPQPDGSKMGEAKSNVDATSVSWFDHGTGVCDPKQRKPTFEHELAIANINPEVDNKSEIFAIVGLRPNAANDPVPTCYYLIGLEYFPGNGNLKPLPGWGGQATIIGTDRPGAHGVADMDGDGKAEIYFRDRIYAAETGKLLAYGNGDWDKDVTSGPVAVDVIKGDNGRMELVAGTLIYTIPNLSNRNPATPALMTPALRMNDLLAPADQAFVKLANDPNEYGVDTHSMCSVADMDRDGFIDVIISGALANESGKTTIFYWNVQKNRVTRYIVPDPNNANGWSWGTSRVNIGDTNGNGNPNLSFVAGNQLTVLQVDEATGAMTPLWIRAINDSKSGVVTVTVYDFDSDGNPELVYRDSQQLTIVDGATGSNVLWSTTCQSHTYTEGPIIADVNGDGLTDICVTCNTNNSFDIDAPLQQQALGQVRLYNSTGGVTWTPTRKIWNQQPYFVVNINDNMTLPFPQMDQNLVFPGGTCAQGVTGPLMRLNVFLNQIPFLTSSGCPIQPAPDLAFTEITDGVQVFPAVEVVPNLCGDYQLRARFNVANVGDLPITDQVAVSFYRNDPRTPIGVLLYTTTINVVNLQVGGTFTSPYVIFNGPGTEFDLYVVLNDDGTQPIPHDPNLSVDNECRISNNYHVVNVIPVPFQTNVEKINDNYKCPTGPNTGEARIRIYKDANRDGIFDVAAEEVVDYSNYTFQWYAGAAADWTPQTPPLSLTGVITTNYNLVGVPDGTYTVVVTNTLSNCIGVPVEVTIDLFPQLPIAEVFITDQTECSPNLNGEIRLEVAGGNAGVTFRFQDESGNVLANSTSNVLGGLKGNADYLIIVDRAGCENQYPAHLEAPKLPDVNALTLQHVVSCNNLQSGSVTAEAFIDGIQQLDADFNFSWYFVNGDELTGTRGSILPLGNETFPTRTSLGEGTYEVVAFDLRSKCESTPKRTTVLNETFLADAVVSSEQDQTSCDPANPNGKLRATVTFNLQDRTNEYDFEWYEAQNTLGTPLSVPNSNILDNVKGDGVIYTVKATHKTTQCVATNFGTVNENINVPVIVVSKDDNFVCDPSLAATDFTGKVEVTSVSFATNPITLPDPNYQVTWYDVATNQVIPNQNGTVLGPLQAGSYRVTVTRLDLSCTSLPETREVENLVIPPPIPNPPLATPSTNCIPNKPGNGKVALADADADPATYTYEWRQGTTINGTLIPTVAGKPWESQPLQGGLGSDFDFTLFITNPTSGCRSFYTVHVADLHEIPLLGVVKTDNSTCDEAYAPFTGSMTTTITNQNAKPDSEYIFQWTFPNNTTAGTKNLSGLKDGLYTLVVTHDPTGCVSDPISRQVENTTALPIIFAEGIASTNCDPALPNGNARVISVDGNDPPNIAPYAFKWWHNAAPNTTLSTAHFINGRQGAAGEFYSVEVTNQSDGCKDFRIVEIPDKQRLPAITLNATPNHNCAGTPDGTASLNVLSYDLDGNGTREVIPPADYGGYSAQWYSGQTTASILAGETGFVLGSRASSYYTLTVTKTDVGCTSDPINVFVDEDFVYPAIIHNTTPQTSCDETTPNGVINAGVGVIGAAGFTYSWFEGNGTATPLSIGTVGPAHTVTNLPGNAQYTVKVVNSTTLCESIEPVFLNEFISIPRIDLVVDPIVDCTALGQGSFTANVLIDLTNDNTNNETPVADYSPYQFSWHRGSTLAAPKLNNTTGRILNQLDNGNNLTSGTYTVYVINTITKCESPDVTEVLSDPGPLFDIETNVNFSPASCGDNLGVITAYIDNGGGSLTTTGYTFEWYLGGITNGVQSPPASFYTDPPVAFNGSPLEVDPNNFFGSDGSINPNINYPSPAPALPGHQQPTGQFAGPTLYGRPSGTFTVVVTRNSDGCKEYLTDYLPYQQEPIIIVAEIKPDDCLGDNGEISVSIDVPTDVDPTNNANRYKIWLMNGSNPVLSPPGDPNPFRSVVQPAAATGNIFNGLPSGVYTVVAQENTAFYPTGCFSVPVRVEMIEALPPLLTALEFTANTTCVVSPDPGDGSLQIQFESDPLDPFNPGFPPPPPPLDLITTPQTYTVEVRDEGGNVVYTNTSRPSGDILTIPNLRNEDYDVRIISSHGCEIVKPYTIPWTPLVPEVDDNIAVAPSLYCLPALEANARIEVMGISIAGAAQPLANYRFDWFTDEALTTNIFSANQASGGAVLQNNLNGVAAGTVTGVGAPGGRLYYVTATKISGPGMGCPSPALNARIIDDSIDPAATLEPFADTSCEDVTGEGSLKVTVLNPGSVNTTTYTYDWDQATNPMDIENILGAPSTGVTNNNGDGLGTDDNITDLIDSTTPYSVFVVNDASGCRTLRQATITKNEIPVVIVNATPAPQEKCTFDGSIQVNTITLDGTNDPAFINYYFTWSRDTETNVIVNQVENASLLDINNYPEIESGQYFVKVKRKSGLKPGSGCESAAYPVVIQLKPVYPTVSTATSSNTTCDDNFDGEIRLSPVTTAGPGVGATYSFTNWITPANHPTHPPIGDAAGVDVSVNNPTPPIVIGNAYVVRNVSDGQFIVTVTNDITECPVEVKATVIPEPLQLRILGLTKNDQLMCNPHGSLEVIQLEENDNQNPPQAGDLTEYTFNWFRADPNSQALRDQNDDIILANTLSAANYPTMGAYPKPSEIYYVVGFKNGGVGSGCQTPAFNETINNLSNRPAVTLTGFANSSACDDIFNGRISVRVNEPIGFNAPYTYSYNWNPSNPVAITSPPDNNGNEVNDNGDQDIYTGLNDGTYNMIAVNNQTGCETPASVVIIENLSLSLPMVYLDSQNPQLCGPSSDGQVTVVGITIGGATVDPNTFATDFGYAWTEGSPSGSPVTPIDVARPFEITELPPGQYYVLVTDQNTCQSKLVERELNDRELKKPTISITQTKLQLTCDGTLGSAELEATALDPAPHDGPFEMTWFNSLDGSGTPLLSNDPNVDPTPSLILSNLLEGPYSITVKSLDTECETTKLYIVQDEAFRYRPNIALSPSARSSCVEPPDGALMVRETADYGTYDPNNPSNNSPYFQVYPNGLDLIIESDPVVTFNAVNDPGQSPTWVANNLDLDIVYTVKIIDNNTGCEVTDSRTIPDGRTYPTINIKSQNPLINCDPAHPNGQLEATADGGKVGGYDFEWFAGPDVNGQFLTSTIDPGTGSNMLIGVGSELSPSLEYTVRVTNKLTGCPAEKTGKLEEGRYTPPKPDAFVIQHDTHCVLDDGWLAAEVVEGEQFNHFFGWYNSGSAPKPNYVDGQFVPQPNHLGDNYFDLPKGPYTVYAVDIVTGCVSEPRVIEVEEHLVIPELIFTTTASFCADVKELQGTGRGTGTIDLQLSPADVVADNIAWTNLEMNTDAGTGNLLRELLPGFYQADVTTTKGCFNSGIAEVKTEIRSYNLVSQNNDGFNDSFFIDCISLFPNNNVKIFNRSGVMVYEANHYDNSEKVFKGIGESGLYMTGTTLPIGTYFYVIDKGDGTKPKTGYLELVR